MKTDTSLLNRADFDASKGLWMHVCPLGEHPWVSEDGSERIVQVIDREACERMVSQYPLNGPSARVDIDHKSMSLANTTEASAWGKQAEVRDDGVWVLAELTAHGAPLVRGKVYQFTSPCFPRDGLVDLGNGRMRPTKLGVIALTNDPNLRGQKPLTNRRAEPANPKPNTHSTMDPKAMLLSLLGLPADASDDAISAAVAAAKSANKDSAAMNARIAELETQLANRDLDEHGITDPEQRKLLAPMLNSKDQRAAALGLMNRIKGNEAARQVLHNRQGAPVPGTDRQLSATDKDAEAEKAKAAWIGNRTNELKRSNPNRAHRECFAQAESEFATRG